MTIPRWVWYVAGGAVAMLAMKRQTTVDVLAEAIGLVESHGDYSAVGPLNRGHRAYGKYQILDVNVGPWTNEAIGGALSVDDFLGDPDAQDRTARFKIAQFLARYGNPADVASVWFSGQPLSTAGDVSDVTGTTVPQYVQAVIDAMSTVVSQGLT